MSRSGSHTVAGGTRPPADLPGPPDLPTLRSRRLVLRPFELVDAPAVQRLAGDERIASATLNIPHPYEDGMAEEWIGTHVPQWAFRKQLVLAVTTADDGVVGAIGLTLSLQHRRGELGYWIGVPFWNRGYATEAAGAVVGFGFEELGLSRMVAEHLTRNPASGRVMQKLGMRLEGILREHVVTFDEPEDVACYAILRREWGER